MLKNIWLIYSSNVTSHLYEYFIILYVCMHSWSIFFVPQSVLWELFSSTSFIIFPGNYAPSIKNCSFIISFCKCISPCLWKKKMSGLSSATLLCRFEVYNIILNIKQSLVSYHWWQPSQSLHLCGHISTFKSKSFTTCRFSCYVPFTSSTVPVLLWNGCEVRNSC